MVAAAIHDKSPRRDRPFVRVNCAAIPRDLVESEMFGHEKGSFTGATARRIGRFELADSGTLFLDEVGDLTIEAQAKLLRAIEAKEIHRVGGNRTIRVDVRVIAATNKDLSRAVADGTFREDLYFRLNVIPITLPPLRERGDDMTELIRHFSTVQRQRTGCRVLEWQEDALTLLRAYSWPGNVRELANIVERIAILNEGPVRASDICAVLPNLARSTTTLPARGELGLTDILDTTERELIADALVRAEGNVAEAARHLRTDRPNLYRRMKRLGMTSATVFLVIASLLTPPLRAQHTDSVSSQTPRTSGDTIQHPSEDDGTSPEPPLRGKISIASGKVYNRVEGLPILIGPTFQGRWTRWSIDAAASGVVRTAPGVRVKEPDAGHDAYLLVRFGPDRMFGVGARLYSIVTSVQGWQMPEPDAALATFLLHRDYLDYYGRHGGQLTANWIVTRKTTVTASYADERWLSRDAGAPLSLLHNAWSWRANPRMDEGHFHVLTTDAVLDTRNDRDDPSGGWYLTGSYEIGSSPRVALAPRVPSTNQPSSPSLATDVRYGRVFFDFRRYNRISPKTQVNGRIVFGGWVQGDELPLQRKLSIGGPGTLPGYDFGHPVGAMDAEWCTLPRQWTSTSPAMCDRVTLAQIELRTELSEEPLDVAAAGPLRLPLMALTRRIVGVVFLDAGQGWRTTQPWSSSYKADMGAGVDLGLFGVYAAKAVSDWGEPMNVLLRVRRRF